MKQAFIYAAALLIALAICLCLPPRAAFAADAPLPAATATAAPAAEASGTGAPGKLPVAGMYAACICGAVTGLALVVFRRKGGGRKSYMDKKKNHK